MSLDISKFETARLRGERVTRLHFDELCSLWRDEQVMAMLGGTCSAEKCAAMMDSMLGHWDQYGFGRWVWYEKAGGGFVAMSGFRSMQLDDWPEITLGYLIRPEFWGKGYATEMAHELAGLAFARLGMESLVAVATPGNVASRRVMEKLGMRYQREGIYENLPHVLYEITHAEWVKLHPAE